MALLADQFLNAPFLGSVLSLSSAFSTAAQKSVKDIAYAIELYTQSLTQTVTQPLGLQGYLTVPYLTWNLTGEVVTNITPLYYSDRGYKSFPADAKSNIYFEGRAVQPLLVERSIPITPEEADRVAVQYGEIEFLNQDGGLDNFTQSYSVDGRRVVIKMGEFTRRYDDFGTIFDGTAVEWVSDAQSARLRIRDNSYYLEVPLQATTYAGTGGKEGGSSLAGQAKPLCFGEVFNIQPIYIDPANLIFQFHNRLSQAVVNVRDKGVPLTYSGSDYASYALLAASSPAAGQYSTCLAEGMIKTGSTPEFITMDVRGDAQGSYVNTPSAIAKRILNDFAGFQDGTNIDVASFNTAVALVPATAGWYFTSPISISDAISAFLRGTGFYWGAFRSGTIQIGRLDEPTAESPSGFLDTTTCLDLNLLPPPQSISPPNYRRRVAYQKNWTIQDSGTLAGSVSAANRLLYGQPYSVKSAVDTTVQSNFLLATDPAVVESPFLNGADAQTEADRTLSLYKVQRRTFRAPVKTLGHLLDLGKVAQLTYSRYSLENGKQFRIVGIREDCQRKEVQLTLWG